MKDAHYRDANEDFYGENPQVVFTARPSAGARLFLAGVALICVSVIVTWLVSL